MGNKIIYHIAKVGDLLIGHNYPVRIQSMVNTDTSDVYSTVNQILELAEEGCEIVRITTRSVSDAKLLYDIKNKLYQNNCTIPIIADIHFNPKAAIAAAEYVEKIRINPGNYIDKKDSKTSFTSKETEEILKRAKDNLFELTEICKKHNTAIRIGSNHGSLSDRIIKKYGNTALGMVESVAEFIDIFKELDFYNLVLSLKSSNPLIMLQANRLLYNRMKNNNEFFPIHLGVTEAGAGNSARIKSAIGIGSLLYEGIGDTLRVSLSENPVNEIKPAKIIAKIKETYNNNPPDNEYNKFNTKPKIVNLDIDINDFIDNSKYSIIDVSNLNLSEINKVVKDTYNKSDKKIILKKFYKNINNTDYNHNLSEELIINISFEISYILLHLPIYAFETDIDNNFLLDILQATKIKLIKPEYISCPTCGRTEYDLITLLEDVKAKTSHLKDITIGIMGCIVNGPGEMLGADYGIVGFGKGKVLLYKNGEKVGSPIEPKDAPKALLNLIEKDINK